MEEIMRLMRHTALEAGADTTPSTFNAKPMPPGKSLLLDLPPELRKMIFDEVTGSMSQLLWDRDALQSASQLPLVSHTIRNEFLDHLYNDAGDIRVVVNDLDFEALDQSVCFLFRKNLPVVPQRGDNMRRRLIIEIMEPTELLAPYPARQSNYGKTKHVVLRDSVRVISWAKTVERLNVKVEYVAKSAYTLHPMSTKQYVFWYHFVCAMPCLYVCGPQPTELKRILKEVAKFSQF